MSAPAIVQEEPVLTAATVLAIIGGVLGCLTSGGVISSTQASAWTQIAATFIPFVLPLAAGLWARRKVTPVAKPNP